MDKKEALAKLSVLNDEAQELATKFNELHEKISEVHHSAKIYFNYSGDPVSFFESLQPEEESDWEESEDWEDSGC